MTQELIATEIATIKTIVQSMDKRLFGDDGNGGYVEKTSDRLTRLEHTEAKAKGAFWLFCTLTAGITSFLTKHLLTSRQ